MLLKEHTPTEKRTTVFRRLVKEGPFPVLGVAGATALDAQIAERTGFKWFGISGSQVSTTLLGLPDAGLLTLTETIDNVRRVCLATSLPVQVDAETGYGNAMNVRRTVEAIISAGAASLFLEDQVSPKRCGFVKGKEVISIEEAVGKYRAACDIRDRLDPDFVIVARTDARGAANGSLEEVLRRGRAYLDAGADVFYAEGLQSREEIEVLRKTFPDASLRVSPLAIRPALTIEEMQRYRLCTHTVYLSSVQVVSIYDFLTDYAARGEAANQDFLAQTKDHPLGGWREYDLAGFPELRSLEQKYLPKDVLDRYETSLGEYDPGAAV